MNSTFISDLMEACRGRWPDILAEVGGIPADVITRGTKHQPCPACGGTDRFRFTQHNPENGSWWCNQCGGPNGNGGQGDGLDLLERVQRWNRQQAIDAVRHWLGDPALWRHSPEAEAARQRWEERQAAIARESAARRAEAERRFNAATPMTEADPALVSASYWGRKGLQPNDQIRIEGSGTIIVPMSGPGNAFVGIQAINPNGEKRDHGTKGVCWFGELTSDTTHVAIAEGVATAASIHEATGWPAVVAFGAGSVANALVLVQARLNQVSSAAAIVLAADNDDAGRSAAEQARRRHRFTLAMPPDEGTDFDDMRRTHGLDLVRAWLESAHERDDHIAEKAAGMENISNDSGGGGDRIDPFAGMDDEQRALWQALQQLGEEEDLSVRRYKLAKLAAAHRMPINLLIQIADDLLDPEAAAAERKRVFEVWDEDDLFAPCDEDSLLLHYVIPGIAPVGEAVLLAGEAKSGKSLLMYEAIHAVLNGGEFLGEPCRRGKVLLLQLEENNSLKVRLTGKGITTPENKGRFRVIRNFDATSPKALDQLRRELNVFKPDLVCLDSLRGAMTNSDESENNQSWCRPIKRVIKLCQSVNAALIAIHHTNKNRDAEGIDRVSGSKALIGEFWGIAMLERSSTHEDDPFRTLALTPRDAARYRLKLEYCPPSNGSTFAWRNSGVLAGDATSQNLRSRILALLQSTGELRTTSVCDRFPDEQPETVRRSLYRLNELGLVATRKARAEGQGRPSTLWSINEDHFRGLTVTNPIDGTERVIFAQTGGGDTHTPTDLQPEMSQKPPQITGVLGHVTESAQNHEPPEGSPKEEEMGFVTKANLVEGGCVCVPPASDQPHPPSGGDGSSDRGAEFVVGSEWTDPTSARSLAGESTFYRVWTVDRSGAVFMARLAAGAGGRNRVLEQGVPLTPELCLRLQPRTCDKATKAKAVQVVDLWSLLPPVVELEQPVRANA